MHTFKVGDRVKRVRGGHNGIMNQGDTGTIVSIQSQNDVHVLLDKNNEISKGHDAFSNFELFKKKIRDIEVGDIIIKGFKKSKVLAICGLCMLCSFVDNFEKPSSGWETIENIRKNGWKLQCENETITIDGKTYDKEEVEKRLAELKTI